MLSPPLLCSIFLGLIFVNIFVIGNTKNKLTRSSSSTCTRCFQTEDDEEEFELFLQSAETLEESNAWAARPVEFSHDDSEGKDLEPRNDQEDQEGEDQRALAVTTLFVKKFSSDEMERMKGQHRTEAQCEFVRLQHEDILR